MAKISAGILMCRRKPTGGGAALQVLLAHPGGPFWARKDAGAWTIPKGEPNEGERLEDAAVREFEEETGIRPADELVMLGSIKQKGGKIVHAWAFEGDCDPATLRGNTFEMEWPPGPDRTQRFPEIDRAAWFDLQEAKQKINPAQAAWLKTLPDRL